MDEVGTAHQAAEARRVLAEFPDVRILDAHAATRGRCQQTVPGDGRHYPAVEAVVALDLVSRVARGLRGEPDTSMLRAGKKRTKMCVM